jgi:flagellar biosynthesis protein FlhF
VTGGIALQSGQRKVVALVGATGVGKTTNLAKLSALFSVQEHAKVGVITTDTYRVAATDQLQVYANIIDLPMEVVHEPSEMKAALKKLANCDLILIDTAGGSPFNREQMTDMRALLDVAKPDEVHLLASANTSLADLRDVVTNFSLLRPTALFFTKLDETKRYGQLYCLAAEAGLPLSYFSVGQQVPDDIMPASPGTVAKLVIEGDESG